MQGLKAAIAVACFAAGSAHTQTAPAKGSPTAAEQAAALDAIRQYALTYTKNLPNYTCTQTRRETIRVAAGQLQRPPDVIEEQISFIDKKELRKVVKINGSKASPEGRAQRASASSRGEFGNLLDTIFDPETGADLRFDRVATLNRRRVYVFAYHVPQTKGYGLVETKRTLQVARRGFVYADYESRAVVRIEMKCIDIPTDSEYQALELKLNYGPVKVAGGEFVLPADFTLHYSLHHREDSSEAEYTNYRRFSADTTVQFEGVKP
jgi:hypothetical protein